MLPAIILVPALVFQVKFPIAVKSALQLGIAFIGIFMTFDFFVALIKPVIESLIARSGLQMSVLDVGRPPLAAVTRSFKLTPVLLVVFLTINIVMLLLKLTKTVNIDLWNYWHVIFVAVLVFRITGNYPAAVASSAVSFILTLKIAEWSAPWIVKYSGIDGICIPHLARITHFPLARLAVRVFDRIPGLSSVKANPEHIQSKLGLFGEPMILGFVIGLALGIGGGYEIKKLLELAFGFSAVIFNLTIGLPVVVGNLYLASAYAPLFTRMAREADYVVAGGQAFTSFLDGGQLYRGWVSGLAELNPAALMLIPAVVLIVIFAWRDSKRSPEE